MLATLPDSMLVQRAQAGDDAAFAQLYERYAPAIYRYIYVWPISAWLYRIAHDRSVDTLRAQSRRQYVSLEHWSGMCEGPEQSVGVQLDCF